MRQPITTTIKVALSWAGNKALPLSPCFLVLELAAKTTHLLAEDNISLMLPWESTDLNFRI